MTPDTGGRFCDQCSKTVIDFTTWSDSALYEFFSKKTERVCGRFLNTQLNHTIHIPHQPHSRLYRMTIALGLTLIFTQTPQLLAQSRPPETVRVDSNKKAINAGSPYELPNSDIWAYRSPAYIENNIAEATKERPMTLGGPEPTDLVALAPGVYQQPENKATGSIKGIVRDDKKEPLPTTIVVIYEDSVAINAVVTDLDGVYKFEGLLPGNYDLEFAYYGYDTAKTTGIEVSADCPTIVYQYMQRDKNNPNALRVEVERLQMLDQNNPTKRTFSREDIDHIPH